MLALNNVFPRPDRPLKTLLEEAYWHERSPLTDRFQIIRTLAANFLDSGIMVDDHYQDILQRETESSFAVKPGIVFLHTLLPARETRLSILSLSHRAEWDGFKISTAVMLMYTEEDRNLLFHLKAWFYSGRFDPEKLSGMQTRAELLPYLLRGLTAEQN